MGERWWGRGLARYDVGLQNRFGFTDPSWGMRRFWSGNPNVGGSNPPGPTEMRKLSR